MAGASDRITNFVMGVLFAEVFDLGERNGAVIHESFTFRVWRSYGAGDGHGGTGAG